MSSEIISEVNENDPWDVFQEKHLPEDEERQDIGIKGGPRRVTVRRADKAQRPVFRRSE
jgi:hypothetical protein